MKKFNVPLLVVLSLLSLNAAAEFKAAFINSGKILQQAPQMKAANDALTGEFAEREQALRKTMEELKKEEADLQKDAAIMSEDQKSKAQAAFSEKSRKFQFDYKSLQEDVKLRRKEELEKVRNSITKIIQDYSKKQGYDLVFTEGVVYAADGADITDEILEQLNKKK